LDFVCELVICWLLLLMDLPELLAMLIVSRLRSLELVGCDVPSY
jgi:hypothetical protein